MQLYDTTNSAYSIRIEDAANWTLNQDGARILWAIDGMLNDNNAEAEAASKPSEDIASYAACFDGAEEELLRDFAAELATQGW